MDRSEHAEWLKRFPISTIKENGLERLDELAHDIGMASLMMAQHAEVDSKVQGTRDHSTVMEAREIRELPVEVRAFCARRGIQPDLEKGIEAARRHFAHVASLRVYLDRDPEDLDEYVVIEVLSSGDPDVDLRSYCDYLEEWSRSTEWPASRLIILDLNTIPSSTNE